MAKQTSDIEALKAQLAEANAQLATANATIAALNEQLAALNAQLKSERMMWEAVAGDRDADRLALQQIADVVAAALNTNPARP